jgi:signal transduction histidine kinase
MKQLAQSTKFEYDFTSEHLLLLRNLCYIGSFLLMGWALVVYYVEGLAFENWPVRIFISLQCLVTGYGIRRLKLSLRMTEWCITYLGFSCVGYAFFISWQHGLHPTWIGGTLLLIFGILNFLTYIPQTIAISVFALVLSLSTFFYPQAQEMNSVSIVLNFVTAVVLGGYSSIQRNRFLSYVIRSETLQSLVLNNMSEGVLLLDQKGRVVVFNPVAPGLLGMNEQQLKSLHEHPLLKWTMKNEQGELLSWSQGPVFRVLESKTAIRSEILLIESQSQAPHWLDFASHPIWNKADGSFLGILVTYRDVTGLKAALDTIDQQKESLHNSAKLAALGEMSGGIAHEINNPLAIIMASAEQILKQLPQNQDELPTFVQKKTETILRTADRIRRIIASMKSISRQSESDTAGIILFQQVINDVLEISTESFANLAIEIRQNIAPNLSVYCKKDMLAQILMNLINNSRDAIQNHEVRWIDVTAHQLANNFVEIRITDSGSGIPDRIKAKILQPFFTTKEIGKGTGLGLSLVRSMVLNHKGEFFLDDKSPNTSFVIRLPGPASEIKGSVAS